MRAFRLADSVYRNSGVCVRARVDVRISGPGRFDGVAEVVAPWAQHYHNVDLNTFSPSQYTTAYNYPTMDPMTVFA